MMQNMLSGLGQNAGQSATGQNTMPFGGNPFFPMMGSGFGVNPQSQQGLNFPSQNNNSMPFGMFNNPFLMQQSIFNNNQSQQSQQQPLSTSATGPSNNNFSSLFQNLQNVMQKANE